MAYERVKTDLDAVLAFTADLQQKAEAAHTGVEYVHGHCQKEGATWYVYGNVNGKDVEGRVDAETGRVYNFELVKPQVVPKFDLKSFVASFQPGDTHEDDTIFVVRAVTKLRKIEEGE